MSDILLIDDNDLMRGLVSEWLEGSGYTVRYAANSAAALAHLELYPTALIIMDIAMPKHCGKLMVKVLRRKYSRILIIAASAHFHLGLTQSPAAARQLGADRLLAKPFSRKDLLDAVREVFGQDSGR
jgi:DNA-binding response OmpR family regulator